MSLIWKEWCRLCGKTSKDTMKNIYACGRPTTILDIIMKYIPLQNLGDGKYPQLVCVQCNQVLNNFHLYASSCLQIQSMFELFMCKTSLTDDQWYYDRRFSILNEIKCQTEIKSEECSQAVENVERYNSEEQYETHSNFDLPESRHSSEEDYIPIAKLDRTSKLKKKKGKELCSQKSRSEKKTSGEYKKLTTSEKTSIPDVDVTIKNEPAYEDNVAITPSAPMLLKELGPDATMEVKMEKKERRLKSEMLTSCVKYDCYICGHICKNWHALCNHFRDLHAARAKVMCICGKFLASRISIGRHCAKHGKVATYDCSTCGKRFPHLWELQSHLASHLPASRRPHACVQCARGFATPQLLRHHERVHTPLEQRRRHHCHICHIKFASKSSLATHIRAVHEGLKPFVCDQCGKAFATKGILMEHSVRHSDDKPHVCGLCQKSFKTKQCLSIHEDTHSSTVYQCPHCPVLLNSRRTLRMHLFVHDEVARYQCSFCPKTFKRAKDLKNHSNLHTGRRPYSCLWCPRTFANGSNCRAHKRRMHPHELAQADADADVHADVHGHTQHADSNNDEKSEEIIQTKVIYTTIKRKASATLLLKPNFLVPPDVSEQDLHSRTQNVNRPALLMPTMDNHLSTKPDVKETNATSRNEKPFPNLSDILHEPRVSPFESKSDLSNRSLAGMNNNFPCSKEMGASPCLSLTTLAPPNVSMHIAHFAHSNPHLRYNS